MELAVWFWALGTLPLAMGGAGAVAVGPQPWLVLPLGPLQVFVGFAQPPWALRLSLLSGPWFAWIEAPPPRLALGRSPGHALIALVRDPGRVHLGWEIMGSPWLSLFGSLGGDQACGLRLRWKQGWAAALVREGGLSLWGGAYF